MAPYICIRTSHLSIKFGDGGQTAAAVDAGGRKPRAVEEARVGAMEEGRKSRAEEAGRVEVMEEGG